MLRCAGGLAWYASRCLSTLFFFFLNMQFEIKNKKYLV